eukprot:284819591_6
MEILEPDKRFTGDASGTSDISSTGARLRRLAILARLPRLTTLYVFLRWGSTNINPADIGPINGPNSCQTAVFHTAAQKASSHQSVLLPANITSKDEVADWQLEQLNREENVISTAPSINPLVQPDVMLQIIWFLGIFKSVAVKAAGSEEHITAKFVKDVISEIQQAFTGLVECQSILFVLFSYILPGETQICQLVPVTDGDQTLHDDDVLPRNRKVFLPLSCFLREETPRTSSRIHQKSSFLLRFLSVAQVYIPAVYILALRLAPEVFKSLGWLGWPKNQFS